MILSETEIKEIISKNPTKGIWDQARSMNKKLSMHILGKGLDSYINKIESYEDSKAIKIRQKYARSNRDLFDRLFRPTDHIWEARGGGMFLNAPLQVENNLRKVLSQIENGYSSKKWVKHFAFPRYKDDPMGLIMMEISSDQNKPEVYPTYKSSNDIYDALPAGRNLEYVVLKTKEPNIYRVVDDAYDYMVKVEGEDITFLSDKTIPNYFSKVPAQIISDIPKDGIEGLFDSPVWSLVELADEFLTDGSVRRIYKFKHGFPKEWIYASVCGKCNGTRFIEAQACSDCGGTGVKTKYSPDDLMVLSPPDKEMPEIKEKGGFVQPDLDFLKWSTDDLSNLENQMFFTHWGTQQVQDGIKNETATGRFLDVQPVKSRLGGYAEWGEDIEKFIIDHVGEFIAQGSFKGCNVSYGRRFMIEGPDEVWNKYSEARSKGAPQSELDDLLVEYLETKYGSNEMQLQKYKKLMKLEPSVHLTIGESKPLLPNEDFLKKIYFSEFVSELNDIEIIDMPLAKLREKLNQFALAKAPKLVEPVLQPV